MEKSHIYWSVIGSAVGTVAGMLFGLYMGHPKSASIRDVTGDGRPDVIVEGRDGVKTPLLQQGDGSYRTPQEIVWMAADSAEASLDSLRAVARISLDSLQAKLKEIK